jgi:hypothetical protein
VILGRINPRRRNRNMAKTSPWHSTKTGTHVHHDNTSCTEGNNIESHYRKDGTGGLPKCSRCKELDGER